MGKRKKLSEDVVVVKELGLKKSTRSIKIPKKEAPVAAENGQNSAVAAAPGTPWIVCWSKRLDREYYFNTETGETTWEKPDFTSPLRRNAPKSATPPSKKDVAALELQNKSIQNDSRHVLDVVDLSQKQTPTNNGDEVEMQNLSDGEIVEEEPMEVDEVVCHVRKEFKDVVRRRSVEIKSNSWCSSTRNISVMVYVVIDTNIWLQHLNIIRTLKNFRFECSIAVLVVPYVVLQELDFFKDSKKRLNSTKSDNLSSKASAAIDFIYREMETSSPYLMCQPSSVDAEDYPGLDCSRGNDDRVLKCALQIRDKRTASDDSISVSLLCTNDKALLIKSEANDLIAGNINHLDLLLKDIASDPGKYTFEVQATKAPKPIQDNQNDQKSSEVLTIDDIFEFSRQCLSEIVDFEFRRVYGKDADIVYIIKPPWPTLKIVVEVILKHWVAVFRYLWEPPDIFLERFQTVYRIFTKKKKNASEIATVLALIEKIVSPFEKRCGQIIRLAVLLPNLREILRGAGSIPGGPAAKNRKNEKPKPKAPSTNVHPAQNVPPADQQVPTTSPDQQVQQTTSRDGDVHMVSASSSFVSNHPGDCSQSEKPKQLCKVETACYEIWSTIEEKRTEWTKDLISSWQQRSQDHPAATTKLQSLSNVTQHLLDSMDAVFMDNPDLQSMQFKQGAIRFTHALNSFLRNLLPENTACHNLIHLEPSVFESFMSVDSNRSTFSDAGNHLLNLLIAMKEDLKTYGI